MKVLKSIEPKTRNIEPHNPKILVTGSAGYLGEALMRDLPFYGYKVVGLDVCSSPFTKYVGSITDRHLVRQAMRDVDAVLHTAALHRPHELTKSKQDFIDSNISGTLTLLEEAVANSVKRFIFTSTTSAFGKSLLPLEDSAVWVEENLGCVFPKTFYGVTKRAGEDMCAYFSKYHDINCIILRTSRFFSSYQCDEDAELLDNYNSINAKSNEFLFCRVDIEDVVAAHELAVQKAVDIKFGKYIISATSPFQEKDLKELRKNPVAVVSRYFPNFTEIYQKVGFKMFKDIGRVYINNLAKVTLNWTPKYDFAKILEQIKSGEAIGSNLSLIIGSKEPHSKNLEKVTT